MGCKCLRGLVDLVGFEPTTSSMPFKEYQSLAGISTRQKDLARGLVDSGGRHGAAFGRLDSTRTPGLHIGDWHAACSSARGCGLLHLLSAEGDNNRFPYKDDAHGGQSGRRGQPGGPRRPLSNVKTSREMALLATTDSLASEWVTTEWGGIGRRPGTKRSDAVCTSKREISAPRCTATVALPSRIMESHESLAMDSSSAAGTLRPSHSWLRRGGKASGGRLARSEQHPCLCNADPASVLTA